MVLRADSGLAAPRREKTFVHSLESQVSPYDTVWVPSVTRVTPPTPPYDKTPLPSLTESHS